MSNFAIEKLLWQAFTNPAEAGAFRDDPDSYLGRFRIDDDERDLLKSWDVAGLADRGVNPMLLLMGFSTVQPGANMMEYVGRINRPR
jgi:hypothetical protein